MKIKQLSVFLENKTGRINEVTKILSGAGINMQAFSMAETTDFGILRLIVGEVDKAVEVLREANFAVMLTDVVCISCRNEAGALSTILDSLSEQDIFRRGSPRSSSQRSSYASGSWTMASKARRVSRYPR